MLTPTFIYADDNVLYCPSFADGSPASNYISSARRIARIARTRTHARAHTHTHRQNYPGDRPVVSGGVPINCTWLKTVVNGNVTAYSCKLAAAEHSGANFTFTSLFIQGARLQRVRTRTAHYPTGISPGLNHKLEGRSGRCHSSVLPQMGVQEHQHQYPSYLGYADVRNFDNIRRHATQTAILQSLATAR